LANVLCAFDAEAQDVAPPNILRWPLSIPFKLARLITCDDATLSALPGGLGKVALAERQLRKYRETERTLRCSFRGRKKRKSRTSEDLLL
jgi:hypothetical protein